MAESLQGQLLACDVATGTGTGTVSVWLQHELFGKVTDRAAWPGINGVQYFRWHVFATCSDRGVVLRAVVEEEAAGRFGGGSLVVVAEGVTGDDLAFDGEGAAYVATNPSQWVLKLSGLGLERGSMTGERVRILGGLEIAETAGPTAVAFGRTVGDERSIYVTTTGGLVNPVGDGPGLAHIVRADVGVRGEILLQ
jgi:hypothetical protein